MPLDLNLSNLLVLLPYLMSGFQYLLTPPPARPIRPSADRLRDVAKGRLDPIPAHESPAREDHIITGILTLSLALQGLLCLQFPSDFLRTWAELRPMVIILLGLIWWWRDEKRRLVSSPLKSLLTQQVISGFNFIRSHGAEAGSEESLSASSQTALGGGLPVVAKVRVLVLIILGLYLAFRSSGKPTSIMGRLDEKGVPKFIPSLDWETELKRDSIVPAEQTTAPAPKSESESAEKPSTSPLQSVEKALPADDEAAKPATDPTAAEGQSSAPPLSPTGATSTSLTTDRALASDYKIVAYAGPISFDLTRVGLLLLTSALLDVASSTSTPLASNSVLASSVPVHIITGLLAFQSSSLTHRPELTPTWHAYDPSLRESQQADGIHPSAARHRLALQYGGLASIVYGLGLGWALDNYSGISAQAPGSVLAWRGAMSYAVRMTELLMNATQLLGQTPRNETLIKEFLATAMGGNGTVGSVFGDIAALGDGSGNGSMVGMGVV